MNTIPTSQGEKTPEQIVDFLTYINYAHNRDLEIEAGKPFVIEKWRRLYGSKTDAMEAKYQAEKGGER